MLITLAGLGGEREREHEPVEAGEHLAQPIERQGGAGLVALRLSAQPDHVHAQSAGEASDLEPDGAEAHDGDAIPLEVVDRPGLPAVFALGGQPAGQVPREGEHVEQDGLRDGHGVRARGRGEPDAPLEKAVEDLVVDPRARRVQPRETRRLEGRDHELARAPGLEAVSREERHAHLLVALLEPTRADHRARCARGHGVELRTVALEKGVGDEERLRHGPAG
jgi:hypothetical protein